MLSFWLLTLSACQGREDVALDEMGSKPEYSVLQGLEYEWRGKTIAAPEIRTVGGYEVLGVPSSDGQGTVWVLLRPEAKPLFKVSSSADFVVPRQLVDSLAASGRMSPNVQAQLILQAR